MKPTIMLMWNKNLECYVDSFGNVWVKDLEPGHKLRAEIERLYGEVAALEQHLKINDSIERGARRSKARFKLNAEHKG